MRTRQVFLSHTSDMASFPTDRSFVQAALDALGRAGLVPVDMRYFAAREGEPADYCRQRVRSCDIYLAVVGFRYGSIVPGAAVSYTELEFQEASGAGLPRLVFLLDDAASRPTGRADTDPRAILRFRRMLREAGLIVRTFASVSALELEVFHALTELTHSRTEVVPRQLPAAIPDFTGRSSELTALNRLMRKATRRRGGTVLISALRGTAGVGKTALALHWAHQVADRFPDGQLYVNLRGHGPSGSPLMPAEAIRGFLFALGVSAGDIPPEPDAQTALYRTLLAGRKMLIVLDSARDADQIRPLLPGTAGCLVLVTSRSKLTGLVAADGAQPLTVDLFGDGEARDLLTRRVGHKRVRAEPAAVSQLVRLSAGLPLALSIVAARAAARPMMPLAELSRELADAQGRLDALDAGDPVASIRAVFSWSCQQLSEPAARLFRLLGLHAGPDVTIPAAASLAAVTPAGAAAAVAELADAHLIAEHAPGRYAFHDLLRAYAADLARSTDPESARRDAVYRVLDHYLHTACAGTRLLNPLRPLLPVGPSRPGVSPEILAGAAGARLWFAAERQVLLAAINQAVEAGFDSYAWQLPWAVWLFFDREGYWHDQEAIQLTAIAAARRLGDKAAQAHVYRDLSATYSRLGQLAEARVYCTRALDLHHELGDRLGEARAHNDIMILAEQQGRHAEALGHAQLALSLYQDEGYEPGVAKMLNGVGWMHAQLGEYEQALEVCQQALSMNRDRGDPLNEAATWDSVGYVLFHLGRLDEAITHIRTALHTVEGMAAGYYQTTWLVHLGDAYHAVGDLDQAREAWEQALAILEHLHHSDADQVRALLAALDDA